MKRVHRRPGDAWQRYLARLRGRGIPAPGRDNSRHPATRADEQRLYAAPPSFVDLLPWVEYLPGSQSLLLEDGHSVAAFFELSAVGTEGRETEWLCTVRDALENVLQDSFDELDQQPWVVQLYVQDETDWADYLHGLQAYMHPRAQGTAFSDFYCRVMRHHLQAVSKPGGLFEDSTVARAWWFTDAQRARRRGEASPRKPP